MENKYISQNIDRLDISCKTIDLLKSKKITKISQLLKKTRSNLNELEFESFKINKIDIEKDDIND